MLCLIRTYNQEIKGGRKELTSYFTDREQRYREITLPSPKFVCVTELETEFSTGLQLKVLSHETILSLWVLYTVVRYLAQAGRREDTSDLLFNYTKEDFFI